MNNQNMNYNHIYEALSINYTKCMALKRNKKDCREQCTNKRKKGDLCCKHVRKNIKRIDDSLFIKQIIINCIKLQSIVRMFIIKKLIYRLYGPAFQNLLLSHDNMDPVSQEQIWEEKDNKKILNNEIPKYLFFSYYDSNKYIRVFNILSLLKLLKRNMKHPITNEEFTEKTKNNVKNRIQFMKDKGLWKNEFDKIEKETVYQKLMKFYGKLNNISIFMQNEWFMNLTINDLKQFYNECRDILFHPDNKYIYTYLINNESLHFIKNAFQIKTMKIDDIDNLRSMLLDEINKLITIGENTPHKKMIYYIILLAFSYVCKNVRTEYVEQYIFSN